MMRILHVAQPTVGGVARVVIDLVEDQVRRGWDVEVACPLAGELSRGARTAGAHHVAWCARRAPGPSMASEFAALSRIIGTVDPDLVHLHSMKAGLIGRLVVRGRRPTLYQPHGWPFTAAGRLLQPLGVTGERMLSGWTDAVVCVSGAETTEGMRAGVRARMETVPNGVDLKRFPATNKSLRDSARADLELGEEPLVACVGRLTRAKGQDVLLSAWPTITARHPNARLVFVGEGEERSSLESMAPPGVMFAGHRSDVAHWYQAADVVAAPSRWEGMSLTLLEALASGSGVVASDVNGMREVLTPDGEQGAGAIVPPEDPQALAEAIVTRLSDPALRQREGANGRAIVERRYSLRRHVDRVAGLCCEIMEQRG